MMIFKQLTIQQFLQMFKPKRKLNLIALISIISITLSTSYAADKTLDGIAAIVNSDVIMVSELKDAVQQARTQLKTPVSEDKLFKDVLEKLIMDKLQVQKAKSIGIKIDDAAVDTAMGTIAEQNNLNLQQLRTAIIERGINYKTFRESLRDRLYSDNLRKRQQRINSDISENDVDDLIRAESFNISENVQYELIDIVIPNSTQSVKQFNSNVKRAQNLRNKLLLNSNLSDAEISNFGASKRVLGWKNASNLSPQFSRALSLLGVGEISDVIRDTQGFHILKLVNKKGGNRQEIQEARVRHILISSENPQAKLKATQLRNKILAGEDFAKLAQQHSNDTGSAKNGGQLPMANTSNYVEPFKNASNTLPLNVLSQPIQTRFGWHIIEVLERRKTDKTREAIKQQAQKLVGTKQQSEATKKWLKSLRDEAFIEYRINL